MIKKLSNDQFDITVLRVNFLLVTNFHQADQFDWNQKLVRFKNSENHSSKGQKSIWTCQFFF